MALKSRWFILVACLTFVSDDAQWLWANLLQFSSNSYHRSQHVIAGASHQVFRRLPDVSKTSFSESDPDVQAYLLLLDFLRHHIEKRGN